MVSTRRTSLIHETSSSSPSSASSSLSVELPPPKKLKVSTRSRSRTKSVTNTSSSTSRLVKVAPPKKKHGSTLSTTPSEIPEALYDLIQNAAKFRESLKRNPHNRFAKRKLKYYESWIPIGVTYHKATDELPVSWEYDPETSYVPKPPEPKPKPKPKPKTKKKKKIKITWRSDNYHGTYTLNYNEQKVWNLFRIADKTEANKHYQCPVEKHLNTVKKDDKVVDLLGNFAVNTFNKSCQMYVNKDEDNQVSGAEFMECKFYKLTSKYIFFMTIEAIEQGIPGVYETKVECVAENGSMILLNFKLTDRKPKGNRPWVQPRLESEFKYETVEVQVLQQVTDNFSDEKVLGRGGFGVVYKGEFDDGTKIAVKRMKTGVKETKGMNEFEAEIAVLTKVRHRHLVALLGYCANDNERLLVYEYMPQGTLSQHLFKWREQKSLPLSWKQRVSIALDVGRGVEYLHSLAQQSFIHRDLKPANILLDDDMRAKVADFGLVKNAPDGKYSIETRLAGTFGYMAPEYSATGRVTTKVDVYSFGVVLMQLITGRKALDETMPYESCQLAAWFRRVPVTKENMVKYADKALDTNDNETVESIFKVAELAKHCTTREPYHRPDMGYIVNVLRPLFEQWKPLRQEQEITYYRRHVSLPQALQADDDSSSTIDVFQPNSF